MSGHSNASLLGVGVTSCQRNVPETARQGREIGTESMCSSSGSSSSSPYSRSLSTQSSSGNDDLIAGRVECSLDRRIRFYVANCKFRVVLVVAKERGWNVVVQRSSGATYDAKACDVLWLGRKADIPRALQCVEPWMRINHFPGVTQALACKAGLAQTLKSLQDKVIPQSWVLPDDSQELLSEFSNTAPSHAFIVKPNSKGMGRGIFLSCTLSEVIRRAKSRNAVVQKYIDNPMLLDGFKFDLRLYVFVGAVGGPDSESINCRGFVFRDGLIRLCTTPYKAPTLRNVKQRRMHLTNYSVNKKSPKFDYNTSSDEDGIGHKRSLRWLLENITQQHGEEEAKEIWRRLCSAISDMLQVSWPQLKVEYCKAFPVNARPDSREFGCRCFQLLGVDLLLDVDHKAWLLEVNQLPSFGTGTPLDHHIKKRVVEQALSLACNQATSSTQRSSAGNAVWTESPLNLQSYGDFELVFSSEPAAPDKSVAAAGKTREQMLSCKLRALTALRHASSAVRSALRVAT